MNKKNSRNISPFYRNSDSKSELEDAFLNNLKKISVQPARESIYNQISQIIGTKSKYPTVEAAVEDMKERSGLNAYLKKIQSEEELKNKKTANQEVVLFKTHPNVKSTIDNYCEDSRGNLAIPAIVEKIKEIHGKEISDHSLFDNHDLLSYINNKNIQVKKTYPSDNKNYNNLGKINTRDEQESHDGNEDVFQSFFTTK